jgi:phosphomannomutase
MTIAYTPLHGVGGAIATQALERAGFERVHVATQQRDPDGTFPTVRFPNPEEPGAMDLVLGLARETNADLVFANDPDADRLAVAVPTADGDYRMLTGDQVGVLLGAEIIRAATGPITVVTTVVSSRMLELMAKVAGVDYVEALTGFKWIVNQGLAREKEGFRFAYGYEEALGYTVGSLVPDKDGLSAMVIFAEMATELRRKRVTVLGRLEELYRRYGLHLTAQRSLSLNPGSSGGVINSKLRSSSPRSIAGRSVISVIDLQSGKEGFPASDVLVYQLEGGARVVVRPSGTEPKIKCYYEVCETMAPEQSFADAEAHAQVSLDALVTTHQKELSTLR